MKVTLCVKCLVNILFRNNKFQVVIERVESSYIRVKISISRFDRSYQYWCRGKIKNSHSKLKISNKSLAR